ncbi:MAG: LysM peptidoglycan-binding domain-containing protein [Planctomycetes bacterium]|nr:LysM peptidoglycan-binding domain-containing protein [Planctomycetota bacterium]
MGDIQNSQNHNWEGDQSPQSLEERIRTLNSVLSSVKDLLVSRDESHSEQEEKLKAFCAKVDNLDEAFAARDGFTQGFAATEDVQALQKKFGQLDNKVHEMVNAGASDSEKLEHKLFQLTQTLTALRALLEAGDARSDKDIQALRIELSSITKDLKEEFQGGLESVQEAVELSLKNVSEEVAYSSEELQVQWRESQGEVNEILTSLGDEVHQAQSAMREEMSTLQSALESELDAGVSTIGSEFKEKIQLLKTENIAQQEQLSQKIGGLEAADKQSVERLAKLETKSYEFAEELMLVQEKVESHDALFEEQQGLGEKINQQSAYFSEQITEIKAGSHQIRQTLLTKMGDFQRSLNASTQEQTEKISREILAEFAGLKSGLDEQEQKLSKMQVYVGEAKDDLLKGLNANADDIQQLKCRTEFLGEELEQSKERFEKSIESKAEQFSVSLVETKSGMESSKEEWSKLQGKVQEGELSLRELRDELQNKDNAIISSRHEMDLIKNRFVELKQSQRKQLMTFSGAAAFLFVGFMISLVNSSLPSAQSSDLRVSDASVNYEEPVYENNLETEALDVPDTTDLIAGQDVEPQDEIVAEVIETEFEFDLESTDVVTPAAAPAVLEDNSQANSEVVEYVVRKNDSLWKIAEKYYGKGYKHNKIVQDNQLERADIKPGDILRIYL